MAFDSVVTSLSGTWRGDKSLRGWAGKGWLLGLSSVSIGLGLAHTLSGQSWMLRDHAQVSRNSWEPKPEAFRK